MRVTSLLISAALGTSLFSAEPAKYPIDNDDVRVIDVTQDPHQKTKMHEHKPNRVMIYKAAGTQDIIFENGKKQVLKFRKNAVLWSPATGMHTSEVTSATPVPLVEIELKKPGAGKTVTSPLDPPKVDTKHYKVEFENDQVRVTRVKFGPHETAPMHEHQLNRVIVYLTDSKTKITTAEGAVSETVRKAGEILFQGGAKHTETNTLDTPVEILVTELKY